MKHIKCCPLLLLLGRKLSGGVLTNIFHYLLPVPCICFPHVQLRVGFRSLPRLDGALYHDIGQALHDEEAFGVSDEISLWRVERQRDRQRDRGGGRKGGGGVTGCIPARLEGMAGTRARLHWILAAGGWRGK